MFRARSDGIFLMRGPFRAFTDTRTREYVRGGFGALLAVLPAALSFSASIEPQQTPEHMLVRISFVAQICDGFYPLELEKHHPNGVIFDAHDHSDKTFEVFKRFVNTIRCQMLNWPNTFSCAFKTIAHTAPSFTLCPNASS